jgi:hypothetical protein
MFEAREPARTNHQTPLLINFKSLGGGMRVKAGRNY